MQTGIGFLLVQSAGRSHPLYKIPITHTGTQKSTTGEPMRYESGERLKGLVAVAAITSLLALAVWELFEGVQAAKSEGVCISSSAYTVFEASSISFQRWFPLFSRFLRHSGLLLQMVLKNGDSGHYPQPVSTTSIDSSKIGALSGSSFGKSHRTPNLYRRHHYLRPIPSPKLSLRSERIDR